MNSNNPYNKIDPNSVMAPMQDISRQQSMYQQNMSNMNNLANQALDTKGTSMVQFDPKAMAQALRAGQTAQQPAPVTDNSTMSPDAFQEYMKQYYGNSYNPDAGWSM